MSYHDEQALLDLQEKQNKTGSDGKQKNVPKWSGFSEKDSFQFESKKGNSQHVKITSISIPFHQMVWLLVQLSLAAIPAAIIVMLIWSFIVQIISESF